MSTNNPTAASLLPLVEEYLRYVSGYAEPSTVLAYRNRISSLFTYVRSVQPLDQPISKTTVNGWLYNMIGTKRCSSATVWLWKSTARKFFEWCQNVGHIDINPVDGTLKVKAKFKLRDPMSYDEFRKLLHHAQTSQSAVTYWPYAIMMGYYTGLRLSDIALLKRSGVDLDNEVIRTIPQKTKKVMTTPVEIPIEPTELYPMLKGLLSSKEDDAWPGLDYVHPQMARFQLAAKGALTAQFTLIRDRAGINKSFHCLRHSFCSEMINNGVDAVVAASMSGHKKLETFKRYAHPSLQAKRMAVQKAFNGAK